MNPRRNLPPARPLVRTLSAPDSLAPYGLPLDDDDDPRFVPVSPERRRRLQRYVTATVGVCVAVCLAAMVRVGVERVTAASEPAPSLAAIPALTPSAADPPAPATSPSPAVSEPPAVAALAAPSAPPADPAAKTPFQEKEAARRALEHGKLRDAVSAAERSTAGDPTDADAWLILGAANQELGHGNEARAAFRACLKSAKKGPLRECRAMLH